MNRLAQSSSPYLLQHKDNPVDWYPWGEEALQRAREENKPMLVSIGYSACHWCHVMEHESFEDEGVAEVMNTFFICIKIDREERPDIDQIYMDAVQAMGLQGGWPLNVFLMPDQKPFYGGTYFPKQQWLQVLKNIGTAYRQHQAQLQESADKFAQSLATPDLERFGLQPQAAQFSKETLHTIYQKFAPHFDRDRGGLNRAPKFPMPSHWQYLLRYGHLFNEPAAKEQAILTLREMAWGGIYDQLGGGFARYSVDGNWFVPHFEKMLYDNAQLIGLYAEAYQATKEPLFSKVVHETIAWAERELLAPEGGFYAALDADSEGEEGKFYVWTYAEWEEVLGDTADMLADFYNLSEEGNWEHGNNIPFRREEAEDFARKYDLDPPEFLEALVEGKKKLMEARAQRVRPGLDDKLLAGWNGLMLQGLSKAARIFPENHYQQLAENLGTFIQKHMLKEGRLHRTFKNNKASLHAYLEDYAAVIAGYTELYQLSFNPAWLKQAEELTEYVVQHFSDNKEPLFYFTDSSAENLIARKKELFDNVIPSSNAIMAENLHKLGLLLGKPAYTERASQMLGTLQRLLLAEPQYLTYWACLAVQLARPSTEIAILGPDHQAAGRELDRHYLPQALLAGSGSASKSVALLAGKEVIDGKTTYYVCFNQACRRPVTNLEEALQELRQTGD